MRTRLGIVCGVVLALGLLLVPAVGTAATDPTFALSGSTFTPGATIAFSGTGWDCTDGGDVTISVGGLGVITTVTPDPTGAITGSFTAPSVTGHYIAVADGHNSACGAALTATFDVAVPTTTTTTTTTTTVPATTTTTTTVPSATTTTTTVTTVPPTTTTTVEPETGPGEPEAPPAAVTATEPLAVSG
jgi:hypothetical protein